MATVRRWTTTSVSMIVCDPAHHLNRKKSEKGGSKKAETVKEKIDKVMRFSDNQGESACGTVVRQRTDQDIKVVKVRVLQGRGANALLVWTVTMIFCLRKTSWNLT